MRIYDLLSSDSIESIQKVKGGTINHPINKTSQRAYKEHLIESDIKELMGMNRQIYKRVNGKVKRK